MKRLVSLVAALAAGAAMAVSEDSSILTVSTVGPDRYADGTTVLDGERYAVVWRRGDSAIEFNADGTLVGEHSDTLWLVYDGICAEGGRCPETRLVIDGNFRGSLGNYVVVLLDTRRFDGSGGVTVGGKPLRVNGYVPITNAAVGFSDNLGLTQPNLSAFQPSALPAGVPETPVVTALEVGADEVRLTVTNTSEIVNYTIGVTDSLNAPFEQSAEVHPVAGAAKAQNSITLRVPLNGDAPSQFYRVERKR